MSVAKTSPEPRPAAVYRLLAAEGQEALTDFLDASGMFPAWVARLREQQQRRWCSALSPTSSS